MDKCEDSPCMMDAQCINCAAHSENITIANEKKELEYITCYAVTGTLNCDHCGCELICHDNTPRNHELLAKYGKQE